MRVIAEQKGFYHQMDSLQRASLQLCFYTPKCSAALVKPTMFIFLQTVY